MKRWSGIASFVLFVVLCATVAYWAMQLFKPPARAVAAPPAAVQPPPDIGAAASLFGGRKTTAVASNYQLQGVIASGTPGDSVIIVSADGKPAQAVRAGSEIAPGVKVKEVHPRYVVLLDSGVEKRVELPEEVKGKAGPDLAGRPPVPTRAGASPAPSAADARRTAMSPSVPHAPPAEPAAVPGGTPAGNPAPGMGAAQLPTGQNIGASIAGQATQAGGGAPAAQYSQQPPPPAGVAGQQPAVPGQPPAVPPGALPAQQPGQLRPQR